MYSERGVDEEPVVAVFDIAQIPALRKPHVFAQ
jgi:hypothetical protein